MPDNKGEVGKCAQSRSRRPYFMSSSATLIRCTIVYLTRPSRTEVHAETRKLDRGAPEVRSTLGVSQSGEEHEEGNQEADEKLDWEKNRREVFKTMKVGTQAS